MVANDFGRKRMGWIVRGDARDRAMILDPYKWPLPYLCLKRYPKAGGMPQCGVIHPDSLQVRTHENEPIKKYASVDEMIADGWMVD
jgi:hypothetical protein